MAEIESAVKKAPELFNAELKKMLETKADAQKVRDMQSQLDGIDHDRAHHHGSGGGEDLLAKAFSDSPEFARVLELGRGKAVIKIPDLAALETKTTITSAALGTGTPGVLNPEQVGGIVPLAQRRLFLRDLLFRGTRISTGSAFFLQEQTFTNAASIQQAEGNLKSESADTFVATTRPTVTLAHWLPISRQAMEDGPQLLQFVRNKLLFGLRFREEVQCLYGGGGASDLSGLVTTATAFNTSLLGTGLWNRADILRRAMQQVEEADEAAVGFFVLNPRDWAGIELIKDSNGNYIVGSPQNSATPRLWGRPVVVTTAMAAGTFLAGSSESAELIDRMDATVEISLDHDDYRARNLAMILCESRVVLCTYRPGAFIWGQLTSSPA